MMKSKSIFSRFIFPLMQSVKLQTLQKRTDFKIFLPLYHCVHDNPPVHLKYLYNTRTQKEFISDLDLLLKHYKPISLAEIIDIVNNNASIKEPVFHITFDDGLSEFNSIVAPILLKKGVPATCFLNSEFIDNKNMLFRFKASLLIDTLHHSAAGSETWKEFHKWTEKNNMSKKYYRNTLLNIGYDNKQLLDDLAQKTNLDFNEYLQKCKPYLESKQIKSLIKKGFTFGAHSLDHPEYRYIDENEQIEQTSLSVKRIAETFGLNYKVFSFPFTDHDVSLRFFHSIQKNIDLTFGCAGVKLDAYSKNLQRIPVEEYKAPLETVLKKELLYYWALKTIQKNKIVRT